MDNRSKILSSALRLFAARGYDAVGVQEIAESAGVTKPTLYHYFGSKRGLLETLLSERFAGLYQALLQAAVYRGDLPRTLEEIARVYFGYAAEQRLFYRWQLAMWFAPPQSEVLVAVSRWNEQQQQILEAVFIRAAEDHGNMRSLRRHLFGHAQHLHRPGPQWVHRPGRPARLQSRAPVYARDFFLTSGVLFLCRLYTKRYRRAASTTTGGNRDDQALGL
jgi:AcrR family transcriptional regulator